MTNMKKIISILFVTISLAIMSAPAAYALGINDVLPSGETLFQASGTDGASLPTGSFRYELVPQVIKIMLGLAGTLAFISFTVGGVMLVVAHGNEEMETTAKNIFLYSVIAMVVIAGAYGVIYGVLTLRFQ